MADPAARLEIEVRCRQCGELYFIQAQTVYASQRLMSAGCPGTSSYECAPRFYATLLEPHGGSARGAVRGHRRRA